MDLFIVNIIILFIVFFLLILLTWVWPPDSPWSFWWRTSKDQARIMCKLAKVTAKDKMYDLGCGDGSAVMVATSEYHASAVGIEIDWTRTVIAKLRIWWGKIKGATIIRDNFYNQDLSKATVVFVYLVPRALERLMPKLKRELRNGTRIVSFRYKMNLPLIAEDKKNKIFVYKIG